MSASLKNQQGFSLPEVMVAMVLMVMIVARVIGYPANINEQSRQQKPVPTALAAWLAANATARDFATCQLAGQIECRHRRRMCQHQRYASFTRGQRRRDDPPALPESSVVRSRYVKGLPFHRLDVLEALMEFIVERERLDDPFEPEMILVQSTGQRQQADITTSASDLRRTCQP